MAANSPLERIASSGIHAPRPRIDGARQLDWLGQRSSWFPMPCLAVPAKRHVGFRIRVYPTWPLGFDMLSSASRTLKSAGFFRFLHPSYPKPFWRGWSERPACGKATIPDALLSWTAVSLLRRITPSAPPLNWESREQERGSGKMQEPTTLVRLWDGWLRGLNLNDPYLPSDDRVVQV